MSVSVQSGSFSGRHSALENALSLQTCYNNKGEFDDLPKFITEQFPPLEQFCEIAIFS